MKKSIKRLLSILSMIAVFIAFSCTEDLYVEENNTNHKFIIKTIPIEEFSTNTNLVEKLGKLNKGKKTSKNVNGKIVYSSEYGFYVDTDIASYVEDENGKHSYVFRVYRDSVQNKLDNIIFSSQDNSSYRVVLMSYDLTPLEQQDLENNQQINLSDNTRTTYIIDDNNLTSDIFSKILVTTEDDGCIAFWDVTSQIGCDCEYWAYQYMTCYPSGGGEGGGTTGGTYTPTGNTSGSTSVNNNSGSTTGSGGSPGNMNDNNVVYNTPITGNFKTFQQNKREQCFINDSGLTWDQKAILNSDDNLKKQVLAYLESQVTDDSDDCPPQTNMDFIKSLLNHCHNNNLTPEKSKDYIISNIIVKQIDDSQLDDCTKGILNSLKNLQQDDIAKMIRRFETPDIPFKITFNQITNLVKPFTNQSVYGLTTPTAIPQFNINISLNSNYFNNNGATKLGKATVILHEIMHAVIFSVISNENFQNIDCNDFPAVWDAYVDGLFNGDASNTQHSYIGNNWANILGSALQEYITGIPVPSNQEPDQIYKDLAYSGLINFNDPNPQFGLSPTDRTRIYFRKVAEMTNTTSNNTIPSNNPPCN